MKGQMNAIKEIIKEEIRKKYGHNIHYAKDCQILSEAILKSTSRQISVSTLKRFFGIIKTPFNPSRYTLDTLAIYLDFKNWEDYANSFENSKHSFSSLNSWEQLRERMLYITENCMQSIRTKIGEEAYDLPIRDFAVRKIDSFLNSSKVATAFIAPGGYGKSTLVYQLTEHYFTGDKAKFPNDIVLLIDGGSLVNLVNKFSDSARIQNLLDFNPGKSFSNFFRKNPHELKGRYILIIDGLNEIFYQTEKLTGFIANLLDIIASYENISWFKLIITCHPDNWKILTGIAQKKPSIKKQWFDVRFNRLPSETVNVPLLGRKEIKLILGKRHSPQLFQKLSFHSPQTVEMISHPYFLRLFLLKNEENIDTDIELLNHFISHKVLSEPFSAEKSKIINAIFQHSDYGRKGPLVQKDDLPLTDDFTNAYKDLISKNILYEHTIPGLYFSVTTYVKFSHDILTEFMLANKWLQENKFDLALIKNISAYYSDNRQLRCNLIKYIIKIAFKESKLDLLKDIYSIFSKGNNNSILINMNDVDPEVIHVINIELRKHKEIRDYLIPHYAKSKTGQTFYFETFFDMDSLVLHAGDNINYYLENNPSEDAQIYGHHLKFTQYFFEMNHENLRTEFSWFRGIQHPDRLAPLTAGFYYTVELMSQAFTLNKIDNNTWAKIIRQSEQFFAEEGQLRYNFPIFEYLIANALNYTNRFSETLQIVETVMDRYVLNDHKSTWLYQLLMAFHARALLNTGDEKRGLEIFRQVEFKSISINYNYYVRLRYYLIHVEFLQYENKIQEALQLLQETKSIARMIKFKYFYDQASSYEKKLKADISPGSDAKQEKSLT